MSALPLWTWGVEIVIEPVNHLQVGFNNSLAEVQRLIAEIDVPVFKPMLDTIHMNIEETSLDRAGLPLREVVGSCAPVRE